MSSRRLRVLIQHMPPESHTMTALRNELSDEELTEQADRGEPEKGRWSQTEQLLAGVVDAIRRLEYITICVNTEKKRDRPMPPEPIRRPGAKAKPSRVALAPDRAEFLFRLINGEAA